MIEVIPYVRQSKESSPSDSSWTPSAFGLRRLLRVRREELVHVAAQSRHADVVTGDRQEALERFERAVELPLLVLALAMIPLLVAPLVVAPSDGAKDAILAVEWFIWAAFAFEYVIRLVLTPARWRFVRREWPDLLIVLLPFLRPLRIVRSARALRVLRLVRLVAFLGEAGQEGKRLLVRHQLHYIVLITMVAILGSAALVLSAEEAGGGSIDSFGDALWWAITTVTTVGYGDMFPVTPMGRGVAAFLMVTGIAFFGVLTANVAAFFLERQGERQKDPAVERLDEVLRRLDALERRFEGRTPGPQ